MRVRLQLTPGEKLKRNLSSAIAELNLTNGLLESLETVDPTGDRVKVELKNAEANADVTDADVDIDLPDDVTVRYPAGKPKTP